MFLQTSFEFDEHSCAENQVIENAQLFWWNHTKILLVKKNGLNISSIKIDIIWFVIS